MDKQLDGSRPQGFLEEGYNHDCTYIDEKRGHATTINQYGPASPDSAVRSGPGPSPITPVGLRNNEDMLNSPTSATSAPAAEDRRMCGLRRRHLWELFVLILAIIFAAAVVGGVVGGLQKHGKSSPPPAPAAGNSTDADTSVPVQ